MNWVFDKNVDDELTLIEKLTPTSGARDIRWRLQMCRGNEGK
jgi:hypothetical protein